jgi:hypothetical protein
VARLEEREGQRPESRPDLQDGGTSGEFGDSDDASDRARIGHEVLAERTTGRGAGLVEESPYIAGSEQAHPEPFDDPEDPPEDRDPPLEEPFSSSTVVGGRDDTVGVGPRSE